MRRAVALVVMIPLCACACGPAPTSAIDAAMAESSRLQTETARIEGTEDASAPTDAPPVIPTPDPNGASIEGIGRGQFVDGLRGIGFTCKPDLNADPGPSVCRQGEADAFTVTIEGGSETLVYVDAVARLTTSTGRDLAKDVFWSILNRAIGNDDDMASRKTADAWIQENIVGGGPETFGRVQVEMFPPFEGTYRMRITAP